MKNLYLIAKNSLNSNKGKNIMGVINVLNNMLYIKEQQVPFIDNPVAKYSEGVNSCQYIIMHYTGSTTAKSAHNQYLDPTTQVSWHLTIDRDGNVYQLLGFDKIAWHAGKSQWGVGPGAINGLNPVSIGIEHSNAGPLSEKNGAYVTAFGQTIPNIDVFFDDDGNPWQAFSDAQLKASRFLTLELAKILKVKDILTHAMISPGRKQDTGPAFKATYDDIRSTYRNS